MMNNLSTLPIDLGQPAELKGDNSFSLTESEGRGESFSQLLSQNSLENTRGNKAAKASTAETTEREKAENLAIENTDEEGELTTNVEEEGVFVYQENNEKSEKENEASDVLDNSQDNILAIGKETMAVLDPNDKAEQTAQFLQLLQHSDKTLTDTVIEKKEAVVTQEKIITTAQSISDDKGSEQETLFQQAKQIDRKGEQPIDTNTGKNWRAGIELPVDPPEKLQQLDAAEQKQISKAEKSEQAIVEQGLTIKSLQQEQDNIITVNTTATNAVVNAEITDNSVENIADKNNNAQEKKLTALAQEAVNQANNTVTQQTETIKSTHNTTITPLIAGQQNSLAQEKKLTKDSAEALVASEQADEIDADTVEKSLLEQLNHQTKKQPEQHKVEQQLYSSIVNQNSTTQVSQYSESELKEIQSLQATAEKVLEHNTQSQKIEMLKQAETIAIYKKDFVNNLQDKVMVMVQQKLQQVDIRLDPPELGKMQVKLHLHNDQASVQFVVQNQQAKEALDQSMPRLREMLAEQGINLGNTNVGQQGGNDFMSENHQESSQQVENLAEEEYLDASQVFVGKVVKGSATGIDYYA